MFKLSKKADYGLIALRHLATHSNDGACSASDIAGEYHIPPLLMAKVLQKLAKSGLVAAKHGATGGYTLARDPASITALEVISAIDGPVSITSCETHRGLCYQSPTCSVREPLRRVNEGILRLLNLVTISQMADEPPASPVVELRV